jgi:hypothetical protein
MAAEGDSPEELMEPRSKNAIATLVALAIGCVLIVLVGAVCVVASHRVIVNTSRTAHMRQYVMSVRLYEESIKSESGSYESLSANLWDLCPRGATVKQPVAWQPSCGAGTDGAHLRNYLREQPNDRFEFGAAIVAGDATARPPSWPEPLTRSTPPAPSPADHWYVIFQEQPHGGDDDGTDYVASVSWAKEVTVIEAP